MDEPPDPPPHQPPIPSHKTTTINGRIPPDSLLQIWSHLPLSPLYKFRAVCHHWNTLITTDPLLPTLRHNNHHHTPPPHNKHTLLLILRHTPSDPIKHRSRPALTSTTTFRRLISVYPTSPHTYPLKNFFTPYSDTTLHLLSSRGPVTCFASHLFLYLSNPSTNHSLRLSPPHHTPTSHAAFGFFPVKEHYVLVVISNSNSQPSSHFIEFGPGQAESATWAQIPTPVPEPVTGFGVMVDGLFYWMISQDGPGFVLCLDYEKKSYHVISRPEGNVGEEMLYDQMYLVEFKGTACAVDNFSRPQRMEIWVLHHDYDGEERKFNWVRKYNVFVTGMGRDLVYPFCESESNLDEIVLCNGTRSRLYCYNLKSKSIKQVYKPKQRSFEQLALYTPGLFPLRMIK